MVSSDDLDFGHTIRGFIGEQTVYGRYRLERQLGRGGMGVVWLAYDAKLERPVALKFLPGIVTADPVAIDDLKRETRRSLDLTHPNIVRIYDFVDDAQSAAIAMEYVDGATLSARRIEKANRVFEVGEIAPWIAAACEALHYAHTEARIVHRDLKPANLMLSGKGQLKVADFGIARSISDSVSRVSIAAHSTGGTLAYMSPQQLVGSAPSTLDDIYSLGATIYELLTSRPPFSSGNIHHQVETVVPPSLQARREELEIEETPIPAAWETTVAACLEKDPAKRPQSVAEVAERLALQGNFKAGLPVAKSAVRSAISETPRKGRGGLTVAVLVLLALAGSAGWWFGVEQPRRDAEAAATAMRQAEIETLLAQGRQAQATRQWASALSSFDKILTLESGQVEARTAAGEIREHLEKARGGVVVKTQPSGATVKIGGADLAASPATFKDLKLGVYPLTVESPGYEPVRREVEVRENEFVDPGLLELSRSTGAAEIETQPGGQSYSLRMMKSPVAGEPPVEKTGETPARLADLPTGIYKLILSRSGWPSREEELVVEPGKTAKAAWEFAEGSLEITSNRSDARFSLRPVTDEKAAPRTGAVPIKLAALPVGKYLAEGSALGWPVNCWEVEISKGKNLPINMEFGIGAVHIESTPPGANYRLAGEGNNDSKPYVGKTPADLSEVPTGNYILTVEREGWPVVKRTVSVQGDQTNTLTQDFAIARLNLSANSKGAQVSINGKSPVALPVQVELPPGRVSFSAKLPDAPEISKEIDLEEGRNGEVAFAFDLEKADAVRKQKEREVQETARKKKERQARLQEIEAALTKLKAERDLGDAWNRNYFSPRHKAGTATAADYSENTKRAIERSEKIAALERERNRLK